MRVAQVLKECKAAMGSLDLVIVDDNLQYRSMRFQSFQLARESTCGVFLLHLVPFL